MNTDSLYLHAFNLLPGFGPVRLCRVCEYFDSPKKAFSASQTELIQSGIEPEIALNFLAHRSSLNMDAEAEKLLQQNVNLLNFREKNYPRLLLEISKFPPLLYYKGQMPESEELCVAVVGTRKISSYGRTVVPFLIEPLVNVGVTVVSGLAYGVDTAVQKISIEKQKRTVAIVGNGLDDKSFYPKEHQYIADGIIANGGAIVSEYPPGTPPLKHHFIARNRIISGMSVATVVIECDLKSGSLITAKYALEQDRTVYAVPGPIYAQTSQGPNNLIKMGAKLITDAKDILDDLNLKTLPDQEEAQAQFADTLSEQAVLDLLRFEPITINDLIKQSGIEASEVTSALTFLEMKGKVRNLGGQQYILSR